MASSSSCSWEELAEKAFLKWNASDFVETLPKISHPRRDCGSADADMEPFHGPGPWDRTNIEVELAHGGDAPSSNKLLLFSSNDYLGLSSHPAVRKAVARASLSYGMGVRGSAMICGHTSHHRLLESVVADMTNKEACVITPTGFAANNAFLSALGSIATLLANGKRPSKAEKIAIFSDALNHASIIDGLRLAERLHEVDVFVYKHNDMRHLESMLSNCQAERKVVFTDSLFSMEGDFAPMLELVELRKKYGFLLVIDDAHGFLVCGKNGGGIAEVYGIENQVDICIGTFSKATGCVGGFIACSKKWKPLIQTRGRPYIFSTSLPVPVAAGILAAIEVSKREDWRRKLVWSHVEYFAQRTRFQATSPIISLVIGTEEDALRASRQLLGFGFHVIAIRPPAVAPDACRLRVAITASHTKEDIDNLVIALSKCMKIPAFEEHHQQIESKL